MNREIVIFGASGGGIKVAQTLGSFGIDFHCFVDNNRKKWGSIEENTGKEICSPEILSGTNFRIIIASTHQAEIERQLEEMGLLSCLCLKEDLLFPCADGLIEELQKKYYNAAASINGEHRPTQKIIIDLAEGVQLGGIETWTYTVARELREIGADVEIFARKTQMQPPEDIAPCFSWMDIEYKNFRDNVLILAQELISRSPCTVIINKHTQILYAAYLARKAADAQIRIISVMHNDEIALYRRQRRIEDITDCICCVSKRIKEKLVREFGISPDKVYYKESPVYIPSPVFHRDYTEEGSEPIKVGYAARLTKFQKRADLFPDLIMELQKRQVNYHLTILGDGAYKEKLMDFVAAEGLEERVSILGRKPHQEVIDFWKTQDIFISFSDFEGVGLSLLEAMSQGVIPIETDVAGSEEFVKNGKNGYIVPIEDIKKMADYILKLDKNRDCLLELGKNARRMIEDKCNPAEYGKYIAGLCGIQV